MIAIQVVVGVVDDVRDSRRNFAQALLLIGGLTVDQVVSLTRNGGHVWSDTTITRDRVGAELVRFVVTSTSNVRT